LIVTLTINPAVDRVINVDRLAFDDRAYIQDQTEAAGGRGVNASQVIHAFGGKTLALLTSGGSAGERMEKLLHGVGFPFEAVKVKSESRTNLTISDKQGLTVKLNESGAPLSEEELAQIARLVEARVAKARWLMICGSVPPGVETHYYRELIGMAKAHGVKTLLDTDGEALLHALEARPTVITPNQSEAERLLNRAIITRGQILEAIERIRGMGAESVILSLGARGAIGMGPEGAFEALAPHIDALCPIGAGDALAAAFVWGMDKKKSFFDSLRWGVAAGTAAASLPGMRFPTLDQTKAVYRQVELRAVK
jgi:1-phosphofructokinase family hexose kinase